MGRKLLERKIKIKTHQKNFKKTSQVECYNCEGK